MSIRGDPFPPPQTTTELLDRYVLTTTSGLTDNCDICQEKYNTGDAPEMPVVLPNCTHVYGSQCIAKWIDNQSNSCPMCRKPIVHNANHNLPGLYDHPPTAILRGFVSRRSRRNASHVPSRRNAISDTINPRNYAGREDTREGGDRQSDATLDPDADHEFLSSSVSSSLSDPPNDEDEPMNEGRPVIGNTAANGVAVANDGDAMDEDDEEEDDHDISEGSIMHEVNSPPSPSEDEDRVYDGLAHWHANWNLCRDQLGQEPSQWASHAEALYSDLCEAIVCYIEDPATPQLWLDDRYPLASVLQCNTFGAFTEELTDPESDIRHTIERLRILPRTRRNMELLENHFGQIVDTYQEVEYATAATHRRFLRWHERVGRAHTRQLATLRATRRHRALNELAQAATRFQTTLDRIGQIGARARDERAAQPGQATVSYERTRLEDYDIGQ